MLLGEAEAHRALHHPYLDALENGTLPDPIGALRRFTAEYAVYTKNFQNYLLLCMSKLEEQKHRSILLENLCEESGMIEEEELEAIGIQAEWVQGVPHPEMFARFRKAIEDNAIPVFSEDAHGLVFRYMRYWTERAMAKLDRDVPVELTRLFDFIDADMDQHAVRFQLRRGDMLVANNRTMVHGREAFENAAGFAPRCLVRAWVDGFLDSRSQVLSLRA